MSSPKRGTCSFCGEREGDLDRIGSTRVYLCDDSVCQKQFGRDSKDADDEMRQQAHEDVDRSFGW